MESPKFERPTTPEEERKLELERSKYMLEHIAKQDAHITSQTEQLGIEEKTGLHTYTYLMAKLENALNVVRAGKTKGERADLHAVSLICIDIDHFKQVNDTFGHLAGDEVLQKVADLLKKSVREEDVVARPGGDEFFIMFRGANAKVAMRHAEELRTKITELKFELAPDFHVTASFGISTANGTADAKDAKQLYAEADKALYEAKGDSIKKDGRDRVRAYSGI